MDRVEAQRVDRVVVLADRDSGLGWLLELGGRCILRVRSRRERVEVLEVRDSLRGLGLERVGLGLGIVLERLLVVDCCHRQRLQRQRVRLVLDSVDAVHRATRRIRKLR